MAHAWLISALLLCQPADLARRVAERESQSEAARANYTYRQQVTIEEVDVRGVKAGEYSEVRDIVFSPEKARTEQVVGKPRETLVRLKLTPEDFRDLREVQPLLLTADRLRLYDTRFRGEEEGCWVLEVKPRQILDGQRLFEGLLWIDKTDYSVVRSQGRAVPQLLGTRQENLFPHFSTFRAKMDSGFWFPMETRADDTLPFRTGPLHIRMRIRYSDYKRFGSESTIKFGDPKP